MRFIVLILISLLTYNTANATIIELSPSETRFVAMRADKVNARSGPNIRYPIEWIYQQQNHPVEIIAEYEQWRKIKDHEGTISWVRRNLLTNTRYALVAESGENNIYEKESLNSDVVARAESGVVGKIKKCTQTFCYLEFEDDIKGWMPRSVLYGIKKGEEL
jgi:SH3-like domain-containing protein